MLPSELTNTIEQFIGYVCRNEAHFTYIYVYRTNDLRLTTFTKTLPPNVISPIFFLQFLFRSGTPLPKQESWLPRCIFPSSSPYLHVTLHPPLLLHLPPTFDIDTLSLLGRLLLGRPYITMSSANKRTVDAIPSGRSFM